EKSGRETEINQFGQLDRENYDKLVNVLIKQLEKADILVLAGSVPDGLSKDIYSELLTLSRKHKVKTILDTSGKALKEGIKGKPFLIKPNLKELEELSERKLNDIAEIKKAVKKLINLGLENIVVSLGEKGAVFASKDQLYHVIPPQVKMADTTVGAGDTMVAGISIALKEKFTFQKMASYATSLATLFVSGVPITENHIKRIERELKIIDGGGLE
ncbi:MAG: 1-phosphofructokinase family hexose kinase, partial [Bacillota bacterium]